MYMRYEAFNRGNILLFIKIPWIIEDAIKYAVPRVLVLRLHVNVYARTLCESQSINGEFLFLFRSMHLSECLEALPNMEIYYH